MGYEIKRDESFAHYSVKAPDWQRAIRLDRLGKEYTPLLLLEIEYRKMQRMDGIQVLFELIIELCKLITGNNISPAAPQPLSPEMRHEVAKLNKTLSEYRFLCEKQIDSPQELVAFISEARDITTKIKPLRKELSIARAILEKIPRFEKLLETERQMEIAVTMKHKERRYER